MNSSCAPCMEVPLVSRKQLHADGFTQYHNHWTTSDGLHLPEPLTQEVVLSRGGRGTQRAAGGIGGDEAAVVGCLGPTPPFVSAKNQYRLDQYILILILEISTISKWHLAQVQTLLAFQLFHHYHLSLRPFTFLFDSSSPTRKVKYLLGCLFPRRSSLPPSNPQTLRKTKANNCQLSSENGFPFSGMFVYAVSLLSEIFKNMCLFL